MRGFIESEELQAHLRASLIDALVAINSFRLRPHMLSHGHMMILTHGATGIHHVGTNEISADQIRSVRETRRGFKLSGL